MREFDDHLTAALALADLARPIARAAWLGRLAVEYKADGSALTQADLSIETVWRESLARRFPQHGILGEEYGASAGQGAFTWVLDPIDGTRQFGAGLLNVASLIALCRDGVPVIGIIDLPLAGVRFLGAEGRPTLFDGHPVRCSDTADLAAARVALANPASFGPATRAGYEALRRLARLQVFDGGSPAYGALARGQLDLCLNGEDLDPYDICALCPVVQGAGGAITDWAGAPLGIDSRGAILASAGADLHRRVLDLLAEE